MNPTRVLLSLLAERLGQTAGRWPRQLFGGAEAPTLREAIAARVEPRLMAPDAGQFGDRPLRVFHGTPEEFSPEGIRALTQSPDGGASGAGQTFYRGVREGDALSGEGPIYLHRDPSKASEYAGARFDASGRPLIETTGEGGNVARVTANIRNPIEVSQQEIAALGYEPYRIREMMQRGYDAAIAPNGEVLVFDRNGVRPAIGRAPDAPNSVSRTDGGASGAGQTLDLERLRAEGWDTSQAWTRVVPDNAADPWEVRPLGRFGPGLYFGDATVAEQMTSRVNRIGARQGHAAASHRAYIRDGEMATEHEWRDAYQRNLRGTFGERSPQDAEARAVRELEGRGFIGVVIRDRNDGSMSLNVFRRENILPVPDAPNAGSGASAPSTGTPPKSYKALPRRTPPRPRPPQRPMR